MFMTPSEINSHCTCVLHSVGLNYPGAHEQVHEFVILLMFFQSENTDVCGHYCYVHVWQSKTASAL